MYQERIASLAKELGKEGIGALLVSDPYSVEYLTGIMIMSGERMNVLAVRCDGSAKLLTSKLFPQGDGCPVPVRYYDDTEDPTVMVAEELRRAGTVGVDKTWRAAFLLPLMEKMKDSSFVIGSGSVDRMRQVKSGEELALMREASRLNDLAMERLIPLVVKGYSEKELAGELEKIYRSIGADGFSFEPICGYGKNAADPHHMNDDSKGKRGDSVVLDIGCKKDGYCSDMTRTVFIGEADEEARKIYDIVLEANLRGIAAVKPGAKFSEIDRAAREYIENAGYGEYFTHRLGHSIGREVHEWGDVSAANEETVKEGMVFSIEPGIYLPGRVGVRIEDLVAVTADGCEVLNSFPKKLITVEEQS